MQAKNLLSILFFMGSLSGQAQQLNYNQRPEFLNANKTWAFGTNAGLDFNNGGPIAIRTEIVGQEGHASVSDPSAGKLLFYSNGKECWNASGQRMPNGAGLFGNGNGQNGGTSTNQGVCIVPCIDMPGKYYLFSLMGSTNKGDAISYARGVLYYSVVDMDLDSSRGDIESGKKNIVLDKDTLSEGMIAIPGDNCDIWLIVHKYNMNNKIEFRAYHITSTGVDLTPVVSILGTSGTGEYNIGSMSVSPDRTKIAVANSSSFPGGFLLARFIPSTGKVANCFQFINNALAGGIGTCFSPDNSKLYTLHWDESDGKNVLDQFEMDNFDSAVIVSSKKRVWVFPSNLQSNLRLYHDTIYITNINSSYLHRINKPNLTGTACDFINNAITLLTGTKCFNGIGNDVVYPMPLDTLYQKVVDTIACSGQDVLLEPEVPAYSGYLWNDSSVGQTLNAKGPGTYWVRYNENMCQHRIDSFVVHEAVLSPVITTNFRELGTTLVYATYQWLLNGIKIPNANQSTYTVTQNGDYQVIVSNELGCVDTSAIYKVTNFEETSIPDRSVSKASIHMYPNPARDILYVKASVPTTLTLVSLEGKILERDVDTNQIDLHGFAKGVYFLQISDLYNHLLVVKKIVKDW